MPTMGKEFSLKLDSFDIGQILDGLRCRQESWANTAIYLRDDYFPDNSFLCEERSVQNREASWCDRCPPPEASRSKTAFSSNRKAIDNSPVRRYCSAQEKRWFKFPVQFTMRGCAFVFRRWPPKHAPKRSTSGRRDAIPPVSYHPWGNRK